MNFNFQESSDRRRKRLFIPLNAFGFASFVVPIKLRQPAFALVESHSEFRGARFNRRQRWNSR